MPFQTSPKPNGSIGRGNGMMSGVALVAFLTDVPLRRDVVAYLLESKETELTRFEIRCKIDEANDRMGHALDLPEARFWLEVSRHEQRRLAQVTSDERTELRPPETRDRRSRCSSRPRARARRTRRSTRAGPSESGDPDPAGHLDPQASWERMGVAP